MVIPKLIEDAIEETVRKVAAAYQEPAGSALRLAWQGGNDVHVIKQPDGEEVHGRWTRREATNGKIYWLCSVLVVRQAVRSVAGPIPA